MFSRILVLVLILSGVLLWALLHLTTPTSVGPMGVLVVFVLLYIIFLCIFTGLVSLVSYTVSLLLRNSIRTRPIKPISYKKAYYLGSVLALAPVLLFGMQSLGKIGFLEFGLVVMFIVLGCVLVIKR
jgi:hypothetical protein